MVRRTSAEDPSKVPLDEKQLKALAALEHARQIREELLRERGGKLFRSAGKDLDDLREERTRELP